MALPPWFSYKVRWRVKGTLKEVKEQEKFNKIIVLPMICQIRLSQGKGFFFNCNVFLHYFSLIVENSFGLKWSCVNGDTNPIGCLVVWIGNHSLIHYQQTKERFTSLVSHAYPLKRGNSNKDRLERWFHPLKRF